MSAIRNAQAAVRRLSSRDLHSFRQWFTEFQTTHTEERDELRDYFNTDGDELTLRPGVTLTPEQFATLAETRPNKSLAAYAVYEASRAGPEVLDYVLAKLRSRGVSDIAVYNLKSVAVSVIPFMRKHGLRSNPFTVKDGIGAMRFRDGRVKRTPEARELFELLKQPNVSQSQVESLRAKYK